MPNTLYFGDNLAVLRDYGTEAPRYPNRRQGNVGLKRAQTEEAHGRQGELL